MPSGELQVALVELYSITDKLLAEAKFIALGRKRGGAVTRKPVAIGVSKRAIYVASLVYHPSPSYDLTSLIPLPLATIVCFPPSRKIKVITEFGLTKLYMMRDRAAPGWDAFTKGIMEAKVKCTQHWDEIVEEHAALRTTVRKDGRKRRSRHKTESDTYSSRKETKKETHTGSQSVKASGSIKKTLKEMASEAKEGGDKKGRHGCEESTSELSLPFEETVAKDTRLSRSCMDVMYTLAPTSMVPDTNDLLKGRAIGNDCGDAFEPAGSRQSCQLNISADESSGEGSSCSECKQTDEIRNNSDILKHHNLQSNAPNFDIYSPDTELYNQSQTRQSDIENNVHDPNKKQYDQISAPNFDIYSPDSELYNQSQTRQNNDIEKNAYESNKGVVADQTKADSKCEQRLSSLSDNLPDFGSFIDDPVFIKHLEEVGIENVIVDDSCDPKDDVVNWSDLKNVPTNFVFYVDPCNGDNSGVQDKVTGPGIKDESIEDEFAAMRNMGKPQPNDTGLSDIQSNGEHAKGRVNVPRGNHDNADESLWKDAQQNEREFVKDPADVDLPVALDTALARASCSVYVDLKTNDNIDCRKNLRTTHHLQRSAGSTKHDYYTQQYEYGAVVIDAETQTDCPFESPTSFGSFENVSDITSNVGQTSRNYSDGKRMRGNVYTIGTQVHRGSPVFPSNVVSLVGIQSSRTELHQPQRRQTVPSRPQRVHRPYVKNLKTNKENWKRVNRNMEENNESNWENCSYMENWDMESARTELENSINAKWKRENRTMGNTREIMKNRIRETNADISNLQKRNLVNTGIRNMESRKNQKWERGTNSHMENIIQHINMDDRNRDIRGGERGNRDNWYQEKRKIKNWDMGTSRNMEDGVYNFNMEDRNREIVGGERRNSENWYQENRKNQKWDMGNSRNMEDIIQHINMEDRNREIIGGERRNSENWYQENRKNQKWNMGNSRNMEDNIHNMNMEDRNREIISGNRRCSDNWYQPHRQNESLLTSGNNACQVSSSVSFHRPGATVGSLTDSELFTLISNSVQTLAKRSVQEPRVTPPRPRVVYGNDPTFHTTPNITFLDSLHVSKEAQANLRKTVDSFKVHRKRMLVHAKKSILQSAIVQKLAPLIGQSIITEYPSPMDNTNANYGQATRSILDDTVTQLRAHFGTLKELAIQVQEAIKNSQALSKDNQTTSCFGRASENSNMSARCVKPIEKDQCRLRVSTIELVSYIPMATNGDLNSPYRLFDETTQREMEPYEICSCPKEESDAIPEYALTSNAQRGYDSRNPSNALFDETTQREMAPYEICSCPKEESDAIPEYLLTPNAQLGSIFKDFSP